LNAGRFIRTGLRGLGSSCLSYTRHGAPTTWGLTRAWPEEIRARGEEPDTRTYVALARGVRSYRGPRPGVLPGCVDETPGYRNRAGRGLSDRKNTSGNGWPAFEAFRPAWIASTERTRLVPALDGGLAAFTRRCRESASERTLSVRDFCWLRLSRRPMERADRRPRGVGFCVAPGTVPKSHV